MTIEVPPIDVQPYHWLVVRDILRKHVPHNSVWAFGSRANWKAKAFSDLDLAILTEKPMSLTESAELGEAFSESDLPWKVDIVDWSAISEGFREVIARSKVVVQEVQPARRELSILPLEACLDALIDYQGRTPCKVNAGIPLITAKVVKNGRIEPPTEFIAEDAYETWTTRGHLAVGDVVLTTEAPLGEVAQIKSTPVALAQRIIALRGKPSVLDNRYLLFLLQSDEMQTKLIGRSTGTTVVGIKQSELRKIELALPPLNEQRAIAHILGTLDDKTELNRQRNQTLEAMARALFKDWFVDFGPVRAKMAGQAPYLPADLWSRFPDRLDDEGKPEGWEMVPASELIEFNPTEPLRKGTQAPYLDVASLPTSGSWPEPPVLREFGSGMRFRNGDTLLARITPCLENGKTAFIQCLPDDTVGWGSTEYIVMRPKAPVPAEYAYLLARDRAFREHAIRSMTGTSGRQRAQRDSVANFKLASLPDKNLWTAFARQVAPTFESIKSNSKACEALAGLRDTLLPKLISGDLRITNAERFLERAEAITSVEGVAT